MKKARRGNAGLGENWGRVDLRLSTVAAPLPALRVAALATIRALLAAFGVRLRCAREVPLVFAGPRATFARAGGPPPASHFVHPEM